MTTPQEDRPRTGGPKGSGLTPATIEELKRKGLTQVQIAKMYGVTPQAVSIMKRSHGGYSKTPREEAKELFPWVVRNEHQWAYQNRRLRDHGEYVATGGKGMSREKLEKLAAWYERLEAEDVVVEYDPTIPPDDSNSFGGWRYVPRENSDADLMIRVNEYAKEIDEKARMIWRIPRRRPKV